MTVKMICASHTPLMDHVDADPAIDREVRAHFAALAAEVRDYDPELVVIFGPITSRVSSTTCCRRSRRRPRQRDRRLRHRRR
jgi:hypothetical protein